MIVIPVVVVLPMLSVPVIIKIFIHPVSDAVLLRKVVHDALLPFICNDVIVFISLAIPVNVMLDHVT